MAVEAVTRDSCANPVVTQTDEAGADRAAASHVAVLLARVMELRKALSGAAKEGLGEQVVGRFSFDPAPLSCSCQLPTPVLSAPSARASGFDAALMQQRSSGLPPPAYYKSLFAAWRPPQRTGLSLLRLPA